MHNPIITLLRFIAFIIISNTVIYSFAQTQSWANFERYEQANKQLPSVNPGEQRVVFIGNSITDGWIMHHPEYFSQNNYIDRGISGQVTSQILLRFREDVINLNPALVVIAGGTNDISGAAGPYNEDITFGNFITMVELAKANNIKVVIGSLTPCAKITWGTMPDNGPALIESLNAKLKEYAKKNNIPFADYYPHLVVGEDKAFRPEWTWDNIHPNIEGYKVMETVVNPLIAQELSK